MSPSPATAPRPTIDPFDEAPPLTAGLLVDIATGIAGAEALWRPHAHHGPDRRPVRLLATSTYEVWTIGWTTGQQVELHDHGSSAGALVVVEGELTEVTLAGAGLTRTRLRTGTCLQLPVGTVHDVVAPGPAPATSIHVYSPPLRSMSFYDPATGAPLRTEPVAHEVAVHDSTSLVRALDAAPTPTPIGARG